MRVKAALDGESDPEYARLLRWVAEGVSNNPPAESGLLRVDVEPKFRAMRPRQRQQVIVTALYRDGSTRDVTRTAEFRSNEPAVALVDEHGLVSAAERIGDTAIVCLYAGQAGVARMMVPRDQPATTRNRPTSLVPTSSTITC